MINCAKKSKLIFKISLLFYIVELDMELGALVIKCDFNNNGLKDFVIRITV